jgi:hypothetical protein
VVQSGDADLLRLLLLLLLFGFFDLGGLGRLDIGACVVVLLDTTFLGNGLPDILLVWWWWWWLLLLMVDVVVTKHMLRSA